MNVHVLGYGVKAGRSRRYPVDIQRHAIEAIGAAGIAGSGLIESGYRVA
jgi:hypothetical protein